MTGKNVLGLIFSNLHDEALSQLTAHRTMGSVPFCSRYRLIDFPLSNMVNSGITKVGIVTKANYQSLMDHVGTGKPWDLSRKYDGMYLLPPYNHPESGYSASRVDALYHNLRFIRH
ncbi:MAG: glucose-1-phosphate adenylyltransferase subunit GlgD, partial [Clostridiales bacterium]|nr:glucose-1-phosphate adenylyltransferase subunit GlgD [Clostridiales bacterium]